MTREQAKHRLLNIERSTPIHTRDDARDFEALEMAIQALSQEPTFDDECQKDMDEAWEQIQKKRKRIPVTLDLTPCDDAISRDAVLKIIDKWYENKSDIEDLIILITYMSSVTHKSGKWLYKEITDDYRVTGQCSECKERRIIDNFCPNCGACMKDGRTLDEFIEDSKESEDKK